MDRAAKNLALLKNFDDHLRKLQELLAPQKTGAPASYASIPVVETVALIQSDFQQGARALLARRGTASAEQLDGLVEEVARANDGSDRPLADLRKLISGVIGAPKPGTNDDSASVPPQPAAADERSSPRVALGGKDNVYLERRNGVVAPQRRFDIALSFPGEYRTFVESVARSLGRTVGPKRVLYDRGYEAEFARPDLDTYLQRLYHDESFLIAVFLCADYERKEWCGLEWRAVRDLIKRRQASAVMPLRFDMTEIPGLFSIDGYARIGERTPEQVAALILERLSITPQEVPCRVQSSRSSRSCNRPSLSSQMP